MICRFPKDTGYTCCMETANASATCPVTRLLDITGDRWSFLIIRDVFYGIKRFDLLRQHLGISKKILAHRLVRLVETDILTKVPYQQRPVRCEYRLTAKGRDLFPVLLSMMRWGNRWLNEGDQGGTKLVHLGCGETVEAKLVCSHCNEPLTPARVRVEPARHEKQKQS